MSQQVSIISIRKYLTTPTLATMRVCDRQAICRTSSKSSRVYSGASLLLPSELRIPPLYERPSTVPNLWSAIETRTCLTSVGTH